MTALMFKRKFLTLLTIVALFSVTFSIFRSTQKIPITDSFYSLLLSESLLSHHTPVLNGYVVPHYRPFELPGILAGGYAYQLVLRRGKLLNMCPPGGPILSTPLVAALHHHGLAVATNGRFDGEGDARVERIIAAFLMSVLTCIFFLSAKLVLPYRWSLIVALAAAFGTQVWSIGAQALWSFDWQMVLLALAGYLLLRGAAAERDPAPIPLASLTAWSYFVRPTSAVAVVCVSAYVLIHHRRILFRFALTEALWLALFIAYWYRFFGQVLPAYFAPGRLSRGSFGIALANNLFGASRGLFIYVPMLLIVAHLLIRYRTEVRYKQLASLALIICLSGVVTVSLHGRGWWAGWSYGPRLTTELVPWIVLLAILGIDAMLAATARTSRVGWSLTVVSTLAVVLSVMINARGACCIATYYWNGWKDCHAPWSGQRLGDLIADYRYPQFLAGLVSPPDSLPALLTPSPVIDYAADPRGQSSAAAYEYPVSASSYPSVSPGRTLMLHGRSFDRDNGVGIFLTNSRGKAIEPLFTRPGPALTDSSLEFVVPESTVPGPMTLSIANRGCDYSFKRSNSIRLMVLDTIRDDRAARE